MNDQTLDQSDDLEGVDTDLCPAFVFRQCLEQVRHHDATMRVCRGRRRCDKTDQTCDGCFTVDSSDRRPWYVIYQIYRRGDA